ncbi:MAG: D-alanine--D-alanine ligase [Proteobacteria bacterium]|nr:D-alanine--D-alanine ligase [Pseudomonadota bacterium]
MRIGITYDLQQDYLAKGFSEEAAAEFDRPDTIEAIEGTLQELGYDTDRIGNIQDLTARLAAGDRWDLVFNIAEGIHGFGREAQVPALLDAYGIPYTFSDPLVLSLTLHKGMTKHVIRDLGIPTPDFCVVEEISEVDRVDLPFPLFAKPVGEGTGKGISAASRIANRESLALVCRRLLKTFEQPVLIETFLPGREFTVGITGTGRHATAIGVIEVLLQEDAEPGSYSYTNKKEFEKLVKYSLVEDLPAEKAKEVALAAWRGLGCRDGGRIDLRADAAGTPHFLEVNPLAGLNPNISDLPILCTLAGMTYRELIAKIMESALARTASLKPPEKIRLYSSPIPA